MFSRRQGVSPICAAPWMLGKSGREVGKPGFLEKSNEITCPVDQCSFISRCSAWISFGAFIQPATTVILPRDNCTMMASGKMHITLQRVKHLPGDSPRCRLLCFAARGAARRAARLRGGSGWGQTCCREPSSFQAATQSGCRQHTTSSVGRLSWAGALIPPASSPPRWTTPLALTCKKVISFWFKSH